MGQLARAQAQIDAWIRTAPGQVGLVVKDLAGGETLEWSAAERFPAASLIKIPILVEALRQGEAGQLSLDEFLPIAPADRVGGFGVLKELPSLARLSLRDLLTLMIIISDNTATNLCIAKVGLDAVNATAARLGLQATVLQRRMMDMAARERGLDNFTSARDMARVLEMVATGAILTPAACALAVDVLGRQQVNDRLPLLLPAEVKVAHKTGELSGIRHDVGILTIGSRQVVVAALTKAFTSPVASGLIGGEASELIARIGRCVYDAVVG